ncbi:MAG: PIN domain-containing protein [Actinomycetota bacterium]|nr:PIN domain-containing protein [Actinomycetota bacterium]
MQRGLLDTSVLIAAETARPVNPDLLPDLSIVSVVTIAELRAGVLAGSDVAIRSARMATLELVLGIEQLPIDAAVAAQWAVLRVQLTAARRRVNVNDLWIAATAAAHDLTVYTQDKDFDPLAEVCGLSVMQV